MEQILDIEEGQNTFNYANFWMRLAAWFIDLILLIIVQIPVKIAFPVEPGSYMGTSIDALLINVAIGLIYSAGFESSEKQGTLGKMALGIKVTNLNGERISFTNAVGRHLAKYISGFTIFIGYIMAAFTEKKQALHDMMAGTLVVVK